MYAKHVPSEVVKKDLLTEITQEEPLEVTENVRFVNHVTLKAVQAVRMDVTKEVPLLVSSTVLPVKVKHASSVCIAANPIEMLVKNELTVLVTHVPAEVMEDVSLKAMKYAQATVKHVPSKVAK